MHEKDSKDGQAQPWHPADEKPAGKQRKGAPIGTHSFTGSSANVGMPPEASDAERGIPADQPPGAQEIDPLAEPRAQRGDLLGRKS